MFLGAKAPLEIPRPVSKYVLMYVCKRVFHESKKFEACKIKEQNETKWSSARNFVLNKKVKFLHISKCVE